MGKDNNIILFPNLISFSFYMRIILLSFYIYYLWYFNILQITHFPKIHFGKVLGLGFSPLSTFPTVVCPSPRSSARTSSGREWNEREERNRAERGDRRRKGSLTLRSLFAHSGLMSFAPQGGVSEASASRSSRRLLTFPPHPTAARPERNVVKWRGVRDEWREWGTNGRSEEWTTLSAAVGLWGSVRPSRLRLLSPHSLLSHAARHVRSLPYVISLHSFRVAWAKGTRSARLATLILAPVSDG